jgi:hypothetical protein
MALLSEYALTPGVFDVKSYPSDEVANLYLVNLKDVMLHEGLVRDLRNGEWQQTFDYKDISLHKRGKELLKKLIKQNRLRSFLPALPNKPKGDDDWCEEALATHQKEPINGIITLDDTMQRHRGTTLVSSIKKINNAPWWKERGSSVRLTRSITEYLEHLKLILDCSNSIMFIDPNFNPLKRNYRDFRKIIERICKRQYLPLIEIHRKIVEGSGRQSKIVSVSKWENRFKDYFSFLDEKIRKKINVFVWDDFHDRYIISDLIGITVPYGFDTSKAPHSITTWTRVKRTDRDDIQREFDEAYQRHHKLKGKFSLF